MRKATRLVQGTSRSKKKMFVVANRNGILQGLNDYPTVLEFINLCRMIHQEEDG